MTQEEKARAYDEAKARMSRAFNSNRCTIGFMNEIFPEFKVSEDERIRKLLISGMKNLSYSAETFASIPIKDVIDWLEKHGEKPQGKTELEAINEEKVDNANKVEPKFRVGDWIVNKSHSYLIADIDYLEHRYLFEIGGYTHEQLNWEYIEIADKRYYLWTIQDAKDGDVLSFYTEYKGNKMVQVGIVEKYVGKHGGCSNTFKIYVGVDWENNLQIGEYMGCSDIQPATKEQCDLLFQKMKEAGYEWDAEKKELKIKLKEPDVYEYELERIVDKLNEVIGKLDDIHEVLSKSYVFPYRDYIPPQMPTPNPIPGMDVWYKTHGVEKVAPVTCETLSDTKGEKSPFNSEEEDNEE